MVTAVPTEPLLGEKPVTRGAGGGGVTVKAPGLVAVPAGLLTRTGPVTASIGTVARRAVSDNTVKAVAEPLPVTAVAVLNPVPVTVMAVPGSPLDGLMPMTVGDGTTVNRKALVRTPPGVVTATGPLNAPAGYRHHRDRHRIQHRNRSHR